MIAALAMLMMSNATALSMPASGWLPEEEDVRMQDIEQQAGENDWPFVATKGRLACVPSLGMRMVFFFPEPSDDADLLADPSGVMVTSDPIQLFSDVAGKPHLKPDMTIEDKIRRLAPYVTLGKKLCDQPKSTHLGPSEL